jgi:hypothetical protein
MAMVTVSLAVVDGFVPVVPMVPTGTSSLLVGVSFARLVAEAAEDDLYIISKHFSIYTNYSILRLHTRVCRLSIAYASVLLVECMVCLAGSRLTPRYHWRSWCLHPPHLRVVSRPAPSFRRQRRWEAGGTDVGCRVAEGNSDTEPSDPMFNYSRSTPIY